MILEEDEAFLKHFGVKGMKWGVRNEDPTLTNTNVAKLKKKQEKKEAKIAQRIAGSKNLEKQISDLENNPKFSKSRGLKNQRNALVIQKKIVDKEIEDLRAGRLTDRQKENLKTAAFIGGALAAYGGYKLVQSGEANRMIMKGEAFVKGTPILKQKASLAKPMSHDQIMKDVVKPINPNYGLPGSNVNCRRCTFAYELRRRGYDVAATRTTNGYGQTIAGVYNATSPDKENVSLSPKKTIISINNSSKFQMRMRDTATPFEREITNFKGPAGTRNKFQSGNFFNELSKQPDGSRGAIGLPWALGGAHSIAYEVVNGRAIMFDTQSGKSFKNMTELNKAYEKLGINEIGFTRLDNIKLDEDFLLRWVKNVD